MVPLASVASSRASDPGSDGHTFHEHGRWALSPERDQLGSITTAIRFARERQLSRVLIADRQRGINRARLDKLRQLQSAGVTTFA